MQYSKAAQSLWQEASLNTALYKRDAIKTFDKSQAQLKLRKETYINLEQNTFLKISAKMKKPNKEKRRAKIFLKKGGAHSFVRPGKTKKTKLIIETPSSRAEVKGTDFVTKVDGKENTSLACMKGNVAVSAQGVTVAVKGGFATYVKKGHPPIKPFALPEPPTRNLGANEK